MDTIYREQLMEHFKNPLNKGDLHDHNAENTKRNQLCGDIVRIQLKVAGGIIADAKFDGPACAVSTASSSILTDYIKGKNLTEAKNISKDDLLNLLGVELTTSRIKCATLSLEALKDAIEGYEG